jgi:oligopeptide transport system permease protein
MTLSFLLMHAVPGGPFDGERVLNVEVRKSLEAQYHLDKSLLEQYGFYLRDLLRGDFGPSFKYKDFTVNQLIADGLPVSAMIGLYAMGVALCLGVLLGTLAAWKQNTRIDYCAMGFALLGISVPSFVTAPMMVLIFAVLLRLLPAGEWHGPTAWPYLILPITALSLPMMAYITRLMRGSMIEVLHSSFIRTARAKGLSEFKMITRHALRPALLPVISFVGPATASVMTGSVVIEQIFGLPGIGQHFIKGAINRDYTLVMAVVMISAFLIILFNLLADILYAWIDPRVRYD